MRTDALIQLAGVGIVAYLAYTVLSKANTAAKVAGNAVGSVIADFYTWAVLEGQNMNLQGNIILPDGSLVPLQNVDVRPSPDAQIYANYQGHFYQLYPSDNNGNWPSVLVR